MKLLTNTVWFREAGRRLKAQIWLKSFGIPSFMTLFFVGYFLILNHAFFPVTVMPVTSVDQFIPYQTSAWLLYVSLWVYVQLPPSLIDSRRELILYGWTAAGVGLAGFAVFLLWPTAVPAMNVAEAGAPLACLRNMDTTGNSCPSLHVAFSVFTAIWIHCFLRQRTAHAWLRWLNWSWCLGIMYSTLATKQHVFWDVCAGTVLGMTGAALQVRLSRNHRAKMMLTPDLAQISPAARKL